MKPNKSKVARIRNDVEIKSTESNEGSTEIVGKYSDFFFGPQFLHF